MANFGVSLRNRVEGTKERIDLVARKTLFKLFSYVIQGSPVRTGRFRANWNLEFGTIDTTVTFSTVLSRADTEIAKILTGPLDKVVYLSNCLPYSVKLEMGFSRQAPAGMVRLAVVQFPTFLDQAIAES